MNKPISQIIQGSINKYNAKRDNSVKYMQEVHKRALERSIVATKADWDGSGLTLDKFLKINHPVDEALVMYFIEVLPPVTWSATCIQIGEPYDSDNKGRFTYSTIEKYPYFDKWIYTGNKTEPKYW